MVGAHTQGMETTMAWLALAHFVFIFFVPAFGIWISLRAPPAQVKELPRRRKKAA
jgi:hypothetical protein